MAAYIGIEFYDVAPQVILAYEFGYQIQFELGLFNSPIVDPAEATRRTELRLMPFLPTTFLMQEVLPCDGKEFNNSLEFFSI